MAFLSPLFPFFGKAAVGGKFTQLRPEMILATIEKLGARIEDRFPGSGLQRVCGELRQLAGESDQLARRLGPPIWPVRAASL
ncbi:MAG: hypothetical protein ABIO24_09640, partial [Saprospiraceae bacterium]